MTQLNGTSTNTSMELQMSRNKLSLRKLSGCPAVSARPTPFCISPHSTATTLPEVATAKGAGVLSSGARHAYAYLHTHPHFNAASSSSNTNPKP